MDSKCTPFVPYLQAPCVVHGQNLDRCSPNRRDTGDEHTIEYEVFGPVVETRMKEEHDLLGQRIDSCQIGALMQVAPMASQREIVQTTGNAVLLRYDVLHMME